MDDIVKPGASNLRPKPEDCGVKIENLTAAWTEVLTSISYILDLFLIALIFGIHEKSLLVV